MENLDGEAILENPKKDSVNAVRLVGTIAVNIPVDRPAGSKQ